MITKNHIYHYTMYLCDMHVPYIDSFDVRLLDSDDVEQYFTDVFCELLDYEVALSSAELKYFIAALDDFDPEFKKLYFATTSKWLEDDENDYSCDDCECDYCCSCCDANCSSEF